MTATGFRHPNDRLSRLRAGSIYARQGVFDTHLKALLAELDAAFAARHDVRQIRQ